jgi:hypothetical protein
MEHVKLVDHIFGCWNYRRPARFFRRGWRRDADRVDSICRVFGPVLSQLCNGAGTSQLAEALVAELAFPKCRGMQKIPKCAKPNPGVSPTVGRIVVSTD